ncbi:MAG: fructosamine kinase family protein [Ilumatobacter sp.]|uniref:fructosamine kinase family protein n=1 Tax=Ilumatobacter sp. TaxID=1967498 RepID=UPI00391DD283
MRILVDAVSNDLGSDVRDAHRLGGGDVAESFRMDLVDGRTVFAKTHRDPPPGFFTTEAHGLRWLREPDELAVPEVFAVSDGDDGSPPRLVLEWIEPATRSTAEGEGAFGRALARLHRVGFASFGREDRRTTGSLALSNDPCGSWVEFYGERRLRALAIIARGRGALPDSTLATLDQVIERLDQVGGPPEPPARLHGDLWAGNRMIDGSGRSWLIDPACHGGHREYDLAMMRLFGGFGPESFEGYQDEWPLADGWQTRVPLHQLAPLVAHAVKFGGQYTAATDHALEAVVAI